jgi:uncharacterized surface protein with fasciclin (FAS1) repeats
MKTNNIFRSLLLTSAVVLAFASCKEQEYGDWTANSEPQLDEYIAKTEDLSLFYQIIEQADLKGMVHAYGTYTLFAPVNDAVAAYFGASDVASAQSAIRSLSADSCRAIVKYHMLTDTIHTYDLVNSRIRSANMEQDYLVSAYTYDESTMLNTYSVNGFKVITPDVHTGNGILHVIDGFLARPKYTVMDVFENIDNYADGYSIMTGIMKEILAEPKYAELVQPLIEGQKYITFLAQPDSVMKAEKLTSLEEVLAALSDPKLNIKGYSEEQLLANWVGYHFVSGRYFKTDLSGTLNTCTSLGKVVTTTAVDEAHIYLNRFEVYGEDGILVNQDAELTDFICADGVIQTIEGELHIIERAATRINWDFADQPEIRALSGFRKAGTSQYFYTTNVADESGYVPTDLSMMTWAGKNSPVIQYYCDYEPTLGVVNFDDKSERVYGDHLRFRLGTTVITYLEFQTPTLVTGKYKVWVRYRREGKENLGFMHMVFKQDGQEDQVFGTHTLAAYGPGDGGPDKDQQYAAKGTYAASPYRFNSVITACCLGTIDVLSDGAHRIRLVPDDANSAQVSYDMFYFIPVDLDQVNPRVATDGNDARVYKMYYDADGNLVANKDIYYDLSGGSSADERTHVFPNQCDVVAGKAEPGMCKYTWCPNHDPSLWVETAE